MSIPVNKVNGIGPKTTEYLKAKKITTVAALIKFGVTKLALAPGFSVGRAANAIKEAEKLNAGAKLNSSSSEKKAKKSKPEKKAKKSNKKDKKKDKSNKNKKNKKSKKDKKKDKKKNKK